MAINLEAPRHFNNKIEDEKTTRTNYLAYAKMLGCEKEYLQLINKYDGLLRNCSNQEERKDIGRLGALEVNRLFSFYKHLYVDGNVFNIK